MDTITYYFYYLSSQFEGFSPVVRITVFLTMLLMGLYLISLFRIINVAYRLKRDRKRKSKIRERYELLLEKILFSKTNMNTSEVRDNLALDTKEMKDWEKAYITELVVTMVTKKAWN